MKTPRLTCVLVCLWPLSSCSPEIENTKPPKPRVAAPEQRPHGNSPVPSQTVKPQLSFEEAKAAGHAAGRSRQLFDGLHPVEPDWLHIGPTLATSLVQSQADAGGFLPPGRGAKGMYTYVELLETGARFRTPTSNVSAASLSPSGKWLAVSLSDHASIYKVTKDGVETQPVSELPAVNFGEGRRWFIGQWFWLSEDKLIGTSSEEDARGYDYAETRFYLFDLPNTTLSRIQLPEGLGIAPRQYVKLTGLDSSEGRLRIEETQNGVKTEYVIELKP